MSYLVISESWGRKTYLRVKRRYGGRPLFGLSPDPAGATVFSTKRSAEYYAWWAGHNIMRAFTPVPLPATD